MDANGTAHIDISALFSESGSAAEKCEKFTQVTVVRSDGRTIMNWDYDDLEDAGRLTDLALPTTETATEFTVHCVTDEGDPTVNVNAVREWSRPSGNDWTTQTPYAVAGIDNASLADLAEDITNDGGDALWAFPPNLVVSRGTTVLVMGLVERAAPTYSD